MAEKLCDQVIIIRKGQIRFAGVLDDLIARYPAGTGLEEIFLHLTGDAQ